MRSRSNGLGIHLVTAPWIPQGIRLRRRRARRRKTSIERRCQTPHTDDGKGAIITLGCCAPRALCWANFRRGESLLVMGRIFDFRSGGSSSSYPRRITSLPLCRTSPIVAEDTGTSSYLKLGARHGQTLCPDQMASQPPLSLRSRGSRTQASKKPCQGGLRTRQSHEPQKVYSKVHGGSSSAANASHGC